MCSGEKEMALWAVKRVNYCVVYNSFIFRADLKCRLNLYLFRLNESGSSLAHDPPPTNESSKSPLAQTAISFLIVPIRIAAFRPSWNKCTSSQLNIGFKLKLSIEL